MKRLWRWFFHRECSRCKAVEIALDGYLANYGDSIPWRVRMAVDAVRNSRHWSHREYEHLEERYQTARRKAKNYRKVMKQFMARQRAEKFLELTEEIGRLKRELVEAKEKHDDPRTD